MAPTGDTRRGPGGGSKRHTRRSSARGMAGGISVDGVSLREAYATSNLQPRKRKTTHVHPLFSKLALLLSPSCAARPQQSAAARYANPVALEKASCFIDRFREIVSDPLNLLIERVPEAGYVDENNLLVLQNGNRVPFRAPGSYYDDFSDILLITRGVHEPLEEYCFQELLRRIDTAAPVMLELGAYWGHYSMWLKRAIPAATCYLVEPSASNLAAGRENFVRNGYEGVFIQQMVGKGEFEVDAFMQSHKLAQLDILHADIQGGEVEMLENAAKTLKEKKAVYIFISTHSEALHDGVESALRSHGYRLSVSSSYESHTTSCDGFVLAEAPHAKPVFTKAWQPLGRLDILRSKPAALVAYLETLGD